MERMLTLKRVAVTGGLSSGKSSVCFFFKELGAYVVNADDIVHTLLSTDTQLINKVKLLFGENVIVDGKIDRSKVAKIVFQLEGILPHIEDNFQDEYYHHLH